MKLISAIYLFFILAVTSCERNKDKAVIELETGKNFLFKNKMDSSFKHLNKSLELDTAISGAHYHLAKANYQIKNYKEGLKQIAFYEKGKYNTDSLNEIKLKILYSLKNYDAYVELYNKLISKNPSSYKPYFNKSVALFDKGNKETKDDISIKQLKDALSAINTALSLNNKNSESYVLRGAIRFALSDYKGAIKDLNTVIKSEKNNSHVISQAYRYRGLTEKALNNLVAAKASLDEAILHEKDRSILYINRGDIFILSKKNELACEDFRKALELGDDDSIDRIRENCK
jgi:tetratricopeptide (TPR) repeat protein